MEDENVISRKLNAFMKRKCFVGKELEANDYQPSLRGSLECSMLFKNGVPDLAEFNNNPDFSPEFMAFGYKFVCVLGLKHRDQCHSLLPPQI